LDEEKSKRWCKPPYGLVPRAIYQVGLSLEAISLFIVLCTFSNGETGEAYPGRDRLMEMCGIKSPSTFAKGLKELEEAGVVKTTRSRQGRGGAFIKNVYKLIDPVTLLKRESEEGEIISIKPSGSTRGTRKTKPTGRIKKSNSSEEQG